MAMLVAAGLFFLGLHLLVSGTTLRDRIVATTGEQPYLGLFSAASLGGIVWLCWAYARADYTELWGQVAVLYPVMLVTVFVALELVVVGLTTPSPTAVEGESKLDGEPARGILSITRHPFLWGVAIWAVSHLIVNGDAASLVFFGTLLVLSVSGTVSIDRKLARRYGSKWQDFAGGTSNVPFAAIAGGRARLDLGGLGWWRLAAGAVGYVGLLLTHAWMFGVSPLPV